MTKKKTDTPTPPAPKPDETPKKAPPKAEPRKRGPRTLPVLKHSRRREFAGNKPGRVKSTEEGFFIPGPRATEYEKATGNRFICPAGPGMKPIPKGGQWYPVTVYLLKQVRDGSAAEGDPPKAERKDIKLTAEGGKEQ